MTLSKEHSSLKAIPGLNIKVKGQALTPTGGNSTLNHNQCGPELRGSWCLEITFATFCAISPPSPFTFYFIRVNKALFVSSVLRRCLENYCPKNDLFNFIDLAF